MKIRIAYMDDWSSSSRWSASTEGSASASIAGNKHDHKEAHELFQGFISTTTKQSP
jgi:hypothetical protein